MENKTMTTVTCVECGGTVPLPSNVVVSEVVQCPECGADLEVTSIEPPEAQLAPEMEEDWGE